MKTMHVNRLLLMAALHFAIMFALTYSVVYTVDHIYPNLNKVYMAGIMTAPMLILEILLMGSMYENKRALQIIMGASVVVFGLFFLFIRQQAGIGDRAFLRSMIPHHSSAILMCERASIEDPEIEDLCEQIVTAQQSEIDLMEEMLAESGGK